MPRYTYAFKDSAYREVIVTETTGWLWWKKHRSALLRMSRYSSRWQYVVDDEVCNSTLDAMIDREAARLKDEDAVNLRWKPVGKPAQLPPARLHKG